jgi:hypothetical protein
MATTNAAITGANNALKNLGAAANAQGAANAGVQVSTNLSKMNKNYTAAAQGFRNVANKLNKLNLPNAAKNFTAAANAAEAAGAARSARNAAQGLKKIQNAMIKNATAINVGMRPQNAVGLA